MTSAPVSCRPARADDREFLLTMLEAGFDWRGDPGFDRSLLERPEVAHYLTGWPRDGDFGVVAEWDGVPVGAAWARLFPADDPGYGFVGAAVPEASIAVAAGSRGLGVGGHLLRRLVEEARMRGLREISLSVEDGNAARRLYERAGFAVVGREGNADTMLLELDGAS